MSEARGAAMAVISPPNPAPFLTDSQLWLCGRSGEKGVAILQDGNRHARVKLPPTLFDLLMILVVAATKPASSGQSWVPSGFVTTDELCRELSRQWGGASHQPVYTKKYVNRTIFRLRRALAAALFPKGKAGREWVNRFLENGTLGYRLSSPPANLRLAVLDGLKGTMAQDSGLSTDDEKGPSGDLAGIDRETD
jgi:hypothetical protein